MKKSLISQETIKFLSELRENNNRPWFEANKKRYDHVQTEAKAFLKNLELEMNKVDQIEKSKLFRIYRDVRFSHDKTPYKTYLSMSMNRQKPYLRGGYYLQITPDQSFMACGFWDPSPSDIQLVRQNIDMDPERFKKAINAPSVKKVWGAMEGDAVKTTPKGFDKDSPNIELLRYKQYIFSKSFSIEEVTSENFCKEIINGYQAIRPFFDYMSDILSHNLNGEPLF
jgi:uncharacterized protein (TIGR02453 family)